MDTSTKRTIDEWVEEVIRRADRGGQLSIAECAAMQAEVEGLPDDGDSGSLVGGFDAARFHLVAAHCLAALAVLQLIQ